MDRRVREKLQLDLVRLADGDRTAFAAVYTVVWPTVRSFCARALGGAPDSEDAAQAALLKIFERASDFDRERDALSWVLGAVAYECRSVRKRQGRRRETPMEREPACQHERTPEDEVIDRDLEAAAHEVLETLRPIDVETLRRLCHDERPALPSPTFRKRVERAIGRLRTAWSSKHGA